MSELRLRPAGPDDAAAIAAVHIASWRVAYRGLLPDEQLAGLDVIRRTEEWHGRLAESDTLLALDGESLLGFCEVLPTSPPHIRALYLDPGARRRGIGRRLLEATAERLRAAGAREVTLDVVEGNADARAFYARVGFTETGESDRWHGLTQLRLHRVLTS
jgi:ribosomal protein S18 acetylase RimI-like enzyme